MNAPLAATELPARAAGVALVRSAHGMLRAGGNACPERCKA